MHDYGIIYIVRVSTYELTQVDPDLKPHLAYPINDDMRWMYEYLKAPSIGPYAHISNVLTAEALDSLAELAIPENGKYSTELLMDHPVAAPLIRTMGNISLMNRYNPLRTDAIKVSLKDETGFEMRLPEHRDFLDGNAVLFNFGVVGKLHYVINGTRVKIDSNEIVVINGGFHGTDVSSLTVANYAPRYGHATPAHAVESHGFTRRKRLLVYADGVPTKVTQIPA